MSTRTTPPFRADHVGSFLRPAYLLEARDQFFNKKSINAEQLRAVEDKAITEIVKFQQDVGLHSITDGEFRRTYFHIDFLEQLGGVKTDIPVTIRKPDGTEELAPPVIRVTGKVQHVKDIQKADFEYLKSQVATGMTPKVTIPSPTMLHFRGGRAGIDKVAYPELEPAFYDDVARAFRAPEDLPSSGEGDEDLLRQVVVQRCRSTRLATHDVEVEVFGLERGIRWVAEHAVGGALTPRDASVHVVVRGPQRSKARHASFHLGDRRVGIGDRSCGHWVLPVGNGGNRCWCRLGFALPAVAGRGVERGVRPHLAEPARRASVRASAAPA